jgi:hypothetical protein
MGENYANGKSRPVTVTAISLFFIFGTLMSGITAAMLLFPGSPIEPLWRLNPRAREAFASMGALAVLLMIAVCVSCFTAAVGLWGLKRWGYWTAIMVLSINLAGDALNTVLVRNWRTLIGLPIGLTLILFLRQKRKFFG